MLQCCARTRAFHHQHLLRLLRLSTFPSFSLSRSLCGTLSLTLLYFSLTQAADDAFIFTHFLRYAGQ